MLPTIATGNVGSALAGEYEVANSLRFDDGSSDYLNRTPASAGNRDLWTWSGWIKRSTLSTNQKFFSCGNSSLTFMAIQFNANDTLGFGDLSGGSTVSNIFTSQVFRDVSAWFHIVAHYDSGNATSTDRLRLYVNGSRVTSLTDTTYPAQNTDGLVNSTTVHNIGQRGDSNHYFDGYMSEVCFIDGQALDPTSFGEFDEDTGIWKPINVSGLTFGTNGFYLDFENSSSLGADVSGNGNNFTVNNLTSIDQTTDTCTNNYATLNPLLPDAETFSNGNTTFTNGSGANWRISGSTIAPSSGKWYCEIKVTQNGGGTQIGVMDMNNLPSSLATDIGSGNWSWSYYSVSGNRRHDGSSVSWGNTYTTGDIMGIAMDLDNYKLYFSKNGTWQDSGDPTSGATGTGSAFDLDVGGNYAFAVSSNDTGTDPVHDCNFGNPAFTITSGNSDGNGYGNFEYSVPSGYYALNTKNLAEYG